MCLSVNLLESILTSRDICCQKFVERIWKDEPLIMLPFACSFDETSMDSCILPAIDEDRRIGDLVSGESVKDSNEAEVTSLEEAKLVIAALRARQRVQTHQMLAWRRTLKLQVSFNYEAEDFRLSHRQSQLVPSLTRRDWSEGGGNAKRSIKAITSENHKTYPARTDVTDSEILDTR